MHGGTPFVPSGLRGVYHSWPSVKTLGYYSEYPERPPGLGRHPDPWHQTYFEIGPRIAQHFSAGKIVSGRASPGRDERINRAFAGGEICCGKPNVWVDSDLGRVYYYEVN
jgi:hypothetical protein